MCFSELVEINLENESDAVECQHAETYSAIIRIKTLLQIEN